MIRKKGLWNLFTFLINELSTAEREVSSSNSDISLIFHFSLHFLTLTKTIEILTKIQNPCENHNNCSRKRELYYFIIICKCKEVFYTFFLIRCWLQLLTTDEWSSYYWDSSKQWSTSIEVCACFCVVYDFLPVNLNFVPPLIRILWKCSNFVLLLIRSLHLTNPNKVYVYPPIVKLNSLLGRSTCKEQKTSVCTGTHGGSETSLNTVVHENIKVYEPVSKIFFEISLNFFKNCPELIFL